MTAEQIKEAIRDYADSHFAGRWEAASVMVTLPGGQAETLVALRGDQPGVTPADRPALQPRHPSR